MRVTAEPVTMLRGSSYNPRQVDPRRLDLIELSLRKLGFLAPIYADADGEILSGHQRHLVAARMGAAACSQAGYWGYHDPGKASRWPCQLTPYKQLFAVKECKCAWVWMSNSPYKVVNTRCIFLPSYQPVFRFSASVIR